MSSIGSFEAARKLVTQPGSLLEVGQVDVAGQSLLGYVNAPASMRDLWMLATGHGDAEYMVYLDERMTYSDAAIRVAAFASWLQGQGIGPGDRVAIAMRNYPEWMLAHWAINAIGAVVVGLNAWWVADEMAYAINDSKPKLLIGDQQRLATFSTVSDQFADIALVSVRTEECPLTTTPWEVAVATGGGIT
ncbi:long-chain fatty acid--CoA ligase [Luminiphilus sp.]|nr:long-chain fatty acid--CoA ligase [Luminiphilus sp.]MDC6485135.1 AMP-binding protein [Luminiphilus sp.]